MFARITHHFEFWNRPAQRPLLAVHKGVCGDKDSLSITGPAVHSGTAGQPRAGGGKTLFHGDGCDDIIAQTGAGMRRECGTHTRLSRHTPVWTVFLLSPGQTVFPGSERPSRLRARPVRASQSGADGGLRCCVFRSAAEEAWIRGHGK